MTARTGRLHSMGAVVAEALSLLERREDSQLIRKTAATAVDHDQPA